MEVETITKEWLAEKGACTRAIKAILRRKGDTKAIIKELIETGRFDGLNWLIKQDVMSRERIIRLTIEVIKPKLYLYEKEYPDDKRPCEAIRAAEQCLEANTSENRAATRLASVAANNAGWISRDNEILNWDRKYRKFGTHLIAWSAAWVADVAGGL